MPRYVGLPTVIEAHQYKGSTVDFPEAFRLAVVRHVPGVVTDVATADGTRRMHHDDWIFRGPDGGFSVMRPAAFEAFFTEHSPASEPARARKVMTNA